MEREHPLFEKSYDELREAFVRARFAEPNIFGRPDIQEWLRDARPYVGDPLDSTNVWKTKGFQKYLVREWNGSDDYRLVGVLRIHANPLDEPPRGFLENVSYRNLFLRLLNTLQKGDAQIYYKWCNSPVSFPVVTIGYEVYVAEFKGPDHILALRKATIEDIKLVLFAEVMNDRPRREPALAWLKNEYAHAISQTRYEASHDFDEACAVSADGTKIVKVEEVLVIAEDRRLMSIYPASMFKANKILRSRDLLHRVSGQGDSRFESIERFVEWLLKTDNLKQQLENSDGQLLERGPWFDKKLRLITEARYCPSPLPDGGREIRL